MALNFDGVDDRVRFNVAPQALRLVGDMSYCAWVQYDTLASGAYQNPIVSYGGAFTGDDDDNYFYYLSVDDDLKLRLYWESAGGAGVNVLSSAAASISSATWAHVGFTRDAAAKSVKFYVNGSQLGTAVAYSDNPAYGPNFGKFALLYLGADSVDPATYNWDGRIAETGTWNRVLSGGEFASLGSGARPWAPSAVPTGLVSYCPLYGYDDGVLHLFPAEDEITGKTGIKDGTDVFSVTHPSVWRPVVATGRGVAASLSSYTRGGRGAFRFAYEAYVRENRGRHSTFGPFGGAGRGKAYQANSYAPLARGGHRVSYDPYARVGRGVHARYFGLGGVCRGGHRVGYDGYARVGRGQHAVLFGYQRAGRGVHRYITLTVTGQAGGSHRVANAALDRYELYRGVDAPADLTAAPWQTFTSLPFTTPALTAGSTYHFVLRRRNAWNLASENVAESTITVAGDATQPATAPSAPTNIAAAAAAGRTVLVTADYAYLADGANAADQFLVYSRSDGTFPDPGTDVPVEVEATQADGVAKLSYSAGPFTEGSVVKVLVRTRRSGTPDVDSTNTDSYTAVATGSGPVAVKTPAAHLGRVAAIDQGELVTLGGGLTLWLRADAIAGVADGGAVSTWTGSGPNAYAFTQGTGSAKPTYRANAVNGRPAVEFDGVDDVLAGTAAALTNTNRRTVFVVAKLLAGFSGGRVILGNGNIDWYVAADAGDDTFSSHRSSGGAQKVLAGTAGAFSTSAFNILAYRWDTAGSNVTVEHFKNGAANGAVTYTDGYGPLNLTTWRVGAIAPGSNHFPGRVAEVLVYDQGLAPAERKLVESYLSDKYGILVS